MPTNETYNTVMPRFVLLYHDCPPGYSRSSHWDFMLEVGDVLRTWALEQLPSSWHVAHHATQQVYINCPTISSTNTVAAEQLGDHRREYLEFEGAVSGNRGHVMRIATGTYQMEIDSPTHYRVRIDGDGINGGVKLTRADVTDGKWSVSCSTSP